RYVSTTNCVPCQVEHARRNGGWRARPSAKAYLEKARTVVEARGGVLLSTQYISAKAKLNVRCGDKHEFAASLDSLTRGTWCRECKRQQQIRRMIAQYRGIEELREFAREQHRGDCLAIKPTPMLSKVSWKCSKSEHPPFLAVVAKVVHSGQWCPMCWQE